MKVLHDLTVKVLTRGTKEENQEEEAKIIQKVTEIREKTNLQVKTNHDFYSIVFVFIAYLFVLSFLTSCNQNELYFEYIEIDKGEWCRDSSIDFNIDTIDFEQIGDYNLFIELTTTAIYPYRDICLNIEHNLKDTIFSNDSIMIKLADDYGKWLGTGVGSLRQYSVPFKSDVHLDTFRNYNLRIIHLMGDDPLKGVDNIGIRIL